MIVVQGGLHAGEQYMQGQGIDVAFFMLGNPPGDSDDFCSAFLHENELFAPSQAA